MTCQICEVRRPRRFCPGVRGDICAPCCGNEREVTVTCPFECEYLQQGREHERLPEVNPKTFPNSDIDVSERFLREHEALLLMCASSVFGAALETEGAVDFDVREALESLVRTYRTAQSGLIYESLPNNPIAAHVHRLVQARLDDFRRRLAEQQGMSTIRDSELLGIFVFLQRLEIQHNNGRRRGRAFLDFLRLYFGAAPAPGPAGSPAGPSSPLLVP
ncbi:MAG: hypothetical protein SFV54_28740 [Bryobacteraceae bacterium]|nr:hypothetical protein [Bryobacteraceae bacterium]